MTITDKKLGFLLAAQAGLIVRAIADNRAPSFVTSVMSEAAAIDDGDIPENIEMAALDFVEYQTQMPRTAPDRFHELPPVDRPSWLPEPMQFVEVEGDYDSSEFDEGDPDDLIDDDDE